MEKVKNIILIITLLTCLAGILFAEDEARLQELVEELGIDQNRFFSGRYIIVFLEPWLSSRRQPLVNDDFFGTFEKESVWFSRFYEEFEIQKWEKIDAERVVKREIGYTQTVIITLPKMTGLNY